MDGAYPKRVCVKNLLERKHMNDRECVCYNLAFDYIKRKVGSIIGITK